MKKQIDWKPLLLCLALPLAVGALAALLTQNGMDAFETVKKPPLTPPNWVFPVVWSILYLLMGYASYRLLPRGKNGVASPLPIDLNNRRDRALVVYAVQLLLNFIWPLLFFGAGAYLAAMVCLLLLWLCVVYLILLALDLDRVSAWLLAPYLLWLTFAAYLNFGVFLRNL